MNPKPSVSVYMNPTFIIVSAEGEDPSGKRVRADSLAIKATGKDGKPVLINVANLSEAPQWPHDSPIYQEALRALERQQAVKRQEAIDPLAIGGAE